MPCPLHTWSPFLLQVLSGSSQPTEQLLLILRDHFGHEGEETQEVQLCHFPAQNHTYFYESQSLHKATWYNHIHAFPSSFHVLAGSKSLLTSS